VTSRLMQPLPTDRAADSAFWSEVYREATKRQFHGAAVRSLQLLSSQVQAGKVVPDLSFLSELLTDTRPVIRYLGLELIAVADPHVNFAASERALSIAVEMAHLGQGPQALIIGGNIELCRAAEQMIQMQTGSQSTIANSARAAFQSLRDQRPIEMMVVVDRVHDMNMFEMLQRLRNSGSLPIAVLADGLRSHEQDFVSKSAGFYASSLTRDPDQMKLVIDQLANKLDVRPMTSDDRTRFAALAGNFLTKITADRNTYSFYPVAEWHSQLIDLPAAVTSQSQTQLLSGLGTKDSQRKLVMMASSTGQSAEARNSAASAFEKSVRQFAIQLSDPDIKDAYERYNQYGPNDPAIAKAMGHILDVIEAQSK
jgi:CheY-like chemotaxis protein